MRTGCGVVEVERGEGPAQLCLVGTPPEVEVLHHQQVAGPCRPLQHRHTSRHSHRPSGPHPLQTCSLLQEGLHAGAGLVLEFLFSSSLVVLQVVVLSLERILDKSKASLYPLYLLTLHITYPTSTLLVMVGSSGFTFLFCYFETPTHTWTRYWGYSFYRLELTGWVRGPGLGLSLL